MRRFIVALALVASIMVGQHVYGEDSGAYRREGVGVSVVEAGEGSGY